LLCVEKQHDVKVAVETAGAEPGPFDHSKEPDVAVETEDQQEDEVTESDPVVETKQSSAIAIETEVVEESEGRKAVLNEGQKVADEVQEPDSVIKTRQANAADIGPLGLMKEADGAADAKEMQEPEATTRKCGVDMEVRSPKTELAVDTKQDTEEVGASGAGLEPVPSHSTFEPDADIIMEERQAKQPKEPEVDVEMKRIYVKADTEELGAEVELVPSHSTFEPDVDFTMDERQANEAKEPVAMKRTLVEPAMEERCGAESQEPELLTKKKQDPVVAAENEPFDEAKESELPAISAEQHADEVQNSVSATATHESQGNSENDKPQIEEDQHLGNQGNDSIEDDSYDALLAAVQSGEAAYGVFEDDSASLTAPPTAVTANTNAVAAKADCVESPVALVSGDVEKTVAPEAGPKGALDPPGRSRKTDVEEAIAFFSKPRENAKTNQESPKQGWSHVKCWDDTEATDAVGEDVYQTAMDLVENARASTDSADQQKGRWNVEKEDSGVNARCLESCDIL